LELEGNRGTELLSGLFHRIEAAQRFGLGKIEAEVLPGTLAEVEAEVDRVLKRALKRLVRDERKSKAQKALDNG
jgi:hypothetical protein